nr:groES-like zinc-binding alcohol dehydrogenase family protein [Tanacetum cinerariifolium]
MDQRQPGGFQGGSVAMVVSLWWCRYGGEVVVSLWWCRCGRFRGGGVRWCFTPLDTSSRTGSSQVQIFEAFASVISRSNTIPPSPTTTTRKSSTKIDSLWWRWKWGRLFRMELCPLPLSALVVKSFFLTRTSLMQYATKREELLETAGSTLRRTFFYGHGIVQGSSNFFPGSEENMIVKETLQSKTSHVEREWKVWDLTAYNPRN